MSVASIVIPAYNEGRVIGRCLEALAASGLDVEIVVAANGCVDDTVEAARGFEGVTVLDIAQASKSNALTLGDEAASAFPRIYLDADIVLGPGALAAMIDALTTKEARVAAPAVRFRTDGASWPVKQYYRLYERTPYVTDGLVGLGVYGISEAGRRRFERFPDLMADDLFIQRLFSPLERLTTAGWFEVNTPKTPADLVRVRTRVARGNSELAAAAGLPPGDYGASTGSTLTAIGGLIRRDPSLIPAAVVYLGAVGAARLNARRGSTPVWHRDESTR